MACPANDSTVKSITPRAPANNKEAIAPVGCNRRSAGRVGNPVAPGRAPIALLFVTKNKKE